MAWKTATELHEVLVAEGLPICGCCPSISHVHETQYGATFIKLEGNYVRVDWQRKPTKDEKDRAIAIVVGSSGDEATSIDSAAELYPSDVPQSPPRKITEVAAFYLYPRAWIIGRPNHKNNGIDLVSIFDEVFRKTIERGITIKVLRFGLFVFDFSQSEFRTREETEFSSMDDISALQLRRLAVLNVYLLCLYAKMFERTKFALEKMVLGPMDTIYAKGLDDPNNLYMPLRLHGDDLPRFRELRDEFFAHAAGGESLRHNAQIKWQREDFLRVVISADVIVESLELLAVILRHPAEHALLVLEMFSHACQAYEDMDFSFSLVTCWTIAERLLHVLWERFIKEQERVEIDVEGKKLPIIDKSRKSRLEDHRSFTSAVIAEFLAFRGVIPFPTFALLSRVRSTRNGWIHDLKSVSREQSGCAIELVKLMLREVEGIDLPVPVVNRISISAQ